MNRKEFKQKCEGMTKLIESCWDENNPDDGLSFDERLEKKLSENEDMNTFCKKNKIIEFSTADELDD